MLYARLSGSFLQNKEVLYCVKKKKKKGRSRRGRKLKRENCVGLKGTRNTKKIPFGHGFFYYLAISAKVLREDRETTLLITNIFSLQRDLQDRRKKKAK